MEFYLFKAFNPFKMAIELSKYKPEEEMNEIDKIDKQMEMIKTHRLTDEDLENKRYSFGIKAQKAKISWYLYNRESSAKDIDKAFGFKYNIANVVMRINIKYFEKVGKVGNEFIWTASETGRQLVERIIREY